MNNVQVIGKTALVSVIAVAIGGLAVRSSNAVRQVTLTSGRPIVTKCDARSSGLARPLSLPSKPQSKIMQATYYASTGSVQTRCIASYQDVYYAYLFVTGAREPSAVSQPFEPPYDGFKIVTFTNVPVGHRYFIRIVSQDCLVGGQTPDNYFTGGTMGLPDCHCDANWTSGCPS